MPVTLKDPRAYYNRTTGTSGMAGTPGVSGFVSITEGLQVSYEEIPGKSLLGELYDNYDFMTAYAREFSNQSDIMDTVSGITSKVNDSYPDGAKENVGKVKNEVVSIKRQTSMKSTNLKGSSIKNGTIQTLKTALLHTFPVSAFTSVYKKIRK